MTLHQAKDDLHPIHIHILKAQAGRKFCEDLHLVERLARFEWDIQVDLEFIRGLAR